MIRQSAIFAFGLLTACSKPVPQADASPAEVIANIHPWNGKIVTVDGWLGQCQGYDCAIYSTLQDAKTVAEGDSESRSWSDAMDRRLSIGFEEKFDDSAFPLQFKRVRLTARVNDTCWQFNCTDRANDLEPIAISGIE